MTLPQHHCVITPYRFEPRLPRIPGQPARSLPDQQSRFYLVAPEVREREVLAQMARPALHEASDRFRLGYLPSGELKQHCDATCRFGEDHTVLLKIARSHGLRP